ncbi:unnamed protein product [Wuchereria bancrofti]|uniref:Uncharacterized protein n=1 Tax=Wuchereria bancrofti TaxID=6293 RepID=A0A3P7G1K7_WUCBA|nr:unnamed protein product [Wuchereria bancrofti]
MNKTQQHLWGLHVDEKLEERWRSFGCDTIKLIERQAFMQRKQFENLKQNLSNTQHALQNNNKIIVDMLTVNENVLFFD